MKQTEEIEFLIEESKKNQEKLEDFFKEISGEPEPLKTNVNVLKRFTKGLIMSTMALKTGKRTEIIFHKKPLPEPPRPRYIEIPVTKTSFKKVILEEPSVEKKIIEEEHPIIISKETSNTIVKAKVTDKFILIEPLLSEQDKKVLSYLNKKFKKRKINDLKYITKMVNKACKKYEIPYTKDFEENIMYYLRKSIGLGKINPLMKDMDIKKITCDGINKNIKVLFKDKELETNLFYKDNETLNKIILKFAEMCKQKISLKNPVLDSQFNSIRVQATLGSDLVPGKFIIIKS